MENTLILKKQNGLNFIESGLQRLSTGTKQNYMRAWNEFLTFTGKGAEQASGKDILNYRESLENREQRQSTINSKLQALQRIFELYVMQGKIRFNIIKEIRKLGKITRTINREIDIDLKLIDVEKCLVKTCKTSVIIESLKNSGMRISELLNIKNKDISDYEYDCKQYKKIRILGKGKKERDIYFPIAFYNKIKTIFNLESDFLFHSKTGRQLNRVNIYKQVKSLFIKYAGKVCGCHKLRHLFATYKIIVEKKSVKAVSKYLGHSSTAITQDMYVHDSLNPSEVII